MKVKHLKAPTKKELKNDLDSIVDKRQDLEHHFDKLEDIFGSLSGSDFYEAVWWLFEAYCDEISKKHNIDPDDLNWFIYDLDCGDSPDTVEITEDGKKEYIDVNGVENFIRYLRSQ